MSGIEASIAGLSINMAQQNLATQVSAALLSKVLSSSEQAANSMISQLAQAPLPVNANDLGGLLDVRV